MQMMSLRQNEEEKKQWEEEKRMAGAYFCTHFLHICAYFYMFYLFACFLHSTNGKHGKMQMDGGKEECIIMKNQNEIIRSSKICAGVKEKEEKEEKVLLEKRVKELEEEVRK